MRLIDADELKVDYIVPSTTTNTSCYQYVSKEQIDNAPTVDTVKHGKWIKNEGRYGWHCSVCEKDDFYAFVRDSDTDENKLQDYYCPNCGARMDG